ncbi:uncharacterized protein LOC142635884 [Castanea sativa]|uniref:uncharacterized protein LOC142635884 n=1 Tax=Castanea sativa TaxID=21020 RepID=UPI003F64FC65
MASDSSFDSSSTLLPFNTMIHMVTIKLSSSNYLLWKSQLLPLLESQGLLGHVDGTLVPPPLFDPPTSQTPNNKHLAWKAADQRLLSLLLSSLTEEAMAEAVGLSTSREVWTALENTFSHRSKAREIRLKDDLQLMKRGTRSVTAYARAFKALCDQLHAIGRPVDGTDKVHWFLRGLGPDFSSFSTAQMAQTPLPCFSDLVSKAESFELFQKSLEPPAHSAAAFTAARTSSHRGGGFSHLKRGRGNGFSSDSSSHGQGRANTNPSRRPPRCQICHLEGHYADRCRQRYDRHEPTAHLAEAFTSSCSLSGNDASDWFLDTGASAHMTPAHSNLDHSTTYTGKDCVVVWNGASLPITHTGKHSPSPNLQLLDVLVVPHLTKNLLSISKLTNDFPLSVTFTNNFFTIQNLQTGKVVAIGQRDGGLYVLERRNSAFISVLKNKSLHASYDLWHARLGHVDDSLAGPSLSHSDPSPASLVPTELPPAAPVADPLVSSHPMLTRAKAGIFKTRHPANLAFLGSSGLLSALLASNEPKGFKTAAKNPAWLATMDEEVQALQNNHTWILVPRPANTNIVGSKWVYQTKYLPDGSIERLKARLVAKGYTQVPGLDYTDTFSPVIKATTIRVVLSLAVTNQWPLRQLDVKNAFLNGHLTEQKALYGLKQAPRAWFQRFSSFLIHLGFYCSRADTSLFVFHRQSDIIYLLLYVDDIILIGNNSSLLDRFTCKLHSEFATKDLGSLSYFLGLEATPTTDGLFLSQLKYARDILTRAQLLDSKPIHTPMVVSQHLSSDGPLFPDPTLYRSLVGALQYLTITRPDIAHAVNSVSQFLHSPTEDHFLAVKRILCYVKGTLHFGLNFRSSTTPGALVAYSDADWAGCPDTRRSTSGYSIYLGNNLVSWSAKKQPTVSRSSCESEYRALALTAAELLWLMHLLRDLKVSLSQQPLLLCDNKSAIFLSSNPVSHKRAKHVELDYHFLRELVVAGKLRTQYVPSHLQEKMDAIMAKVVFEGTKTNDYQIFREVVGEPSHGRILGMGIGIKAKDVYGLTSFSKDSSKSCREDFTKEKEDLEARRREEMDSN